MDRIHLVALLTAIIHLTDTLFYAVRLSGVRTRRLITALSLFQMIALLAGVANMVQAPLLSAIVEQAINAGHAAHQANLEYLLGGIRLIILASSAGTIAAAAIAPIFIFFMNRAVFVYERTGSVSQLLLLLLSPSRIVRLSRELSAAFGQQRRAAPAKARTRWPRPGDTRRRSPRRRGLAALVCLILRSRPLPFVLLLVHILVVSIWTNGVLAALYAGALLPAYRSTASLLSGIVNGMAAVLSNFMIDPVTAVITDQALQGQRDERDMINLTYWMMFTRLLGTILAQPLFIPTVHLVELLTRMMT
jgi:hypothetical protein